MKNADAAISSRMGGGGSKKFENWGAWGWGGGGVSAPLHAMADTIKNTLWILIETSEGILQLQVERFTKEKQN